MKKFIALLLALVCVLGLIGCGNTPSTKDTPANTLSKEDALMEAAQIYMATAPELTAASCVIGNQLSAYRLEAGKLEMIDYEKYPVFVEDKVVAFATCTSGDTGEYITGCGAKFADSFWQKYTEQPNIPVALVYAQDGTYLVRDGETPILLHSMPVAGCAPIQELENYRSSLAYSVP